MAAAGDILVRTLRAARGQDPRRASPRPSSTRPPSASSAPRAPTPAFKGYRGFPGSICASPNSMVVHGIPGRLRAARGDLLSIDIGVDQGRLGCRRGAPFPVGAVTPVARKLLEVTQRLAVRRRRAVPARQPARRRLARHPGARRGRGPRGRALAGRPRRSAARCTRTPRSPTSASRAAGPVLEEGMVLAVEPMVTAGRHAVRMGDDGWAIYSQHGSLAAHFEFTIAVTADGPRILTRGTKQTRRPPARSPAHAGPATAFGPLLSFPVCASQRRLLPAPHALRVVVAAA